MPAPHADVLVALGGPPPALDAPALRVDRARSAADLAAYHALRRRAFVEEQGLFAGSDLDARDEDPATRVLVAREPDGTVVGGVRVFPHDPAADLAWLHGGRLVCHPDLGARRAPMARALVRAACTLAVQRGALRFDAVVQPGRERFFAGLGWHRVRDVVEAGRAHVLMRWPVDRIAALAAATKAPLAALVGGLAGGAGFVGDDGVPVPGSELVAACDAIVPGLVDRDPEWAGWCGMLVCANDLAAMGATRVGALDAVAAPDAAHAARVLDGVRRAALAFGLPVLGGHTTLGAPAALSVTAFGRAADPVRGGGGRVGDDVRLTADLGGRWRPGHGATQWDSTTRRGARELATMLDAVGRARPHAAKDVSMAGLAGTLGMLAEASGCGAELRVADVPRPAAAGLADWLTCFPGFAMLTADAPGAPPPPAGPAASATCGRLVAERGVRLVWPDGERLEVLAGGVTGLGGATGPTAHEEDADG